MFITFEGGEGCGKSTQVSLLAKALEDKGKDIITTREPGGTEGAEAIRKLLVTGSTNRWDGKTELLLHVAARNDHIHRLIRPALEEGKIVVSDRFSDSTMAYQGYGHGLDLSLIKQCHDLLLGGMQPDITFLLDIEPEKGIERTQKRSGDENRYEQMDKAFHTKVRQGFLAISEEYPDRVKVIDASWPINQIHQKIMEIIFKTIN